LLNSDLPRNSLIVSSELFPRCGHATSSGFRTLRLPMRFCDHWNSRLPYFRPPKLRSSRNPMRPLRNSSCSYLNNTRHTVMTVLIRGLPEGLNEEMKSLRRCPRCFARLILKWSRLTTYLSCPNYPDCKGPVEGPKHPGHEIEYCRAA